MEIAPFLVLPLVGGYAFSTIWKAALYHSSREDGHRLYFRAVFYGVFLVVFSFMVHIILANTYPSYNQLLIDTDKTLIDLHYLTLSNTIPHTPLAHIISPASVIAILGLSLLSGIMLGTLLNTPNHIVWIGDKIVPTLESWSDRNNYFIALPAFTIIFYYMPIYKVSSWIENKLLEDAISNNDFERIVLRSLKTQTPILITLSNVKVYAGWAVSQPDPTAERRTLRILPVLSGARDKETQEVKFATNYLELLEDVTNDNSTYPHMKPEDLEIVLPTNQITSIHLFDLSTYEAHFNTKQVIWLD